MSPQVRDDVLREITGALGADVLLIGHMHRPFLRRLDELEIVNPGSVDQPLDGDPRAAYAVWEEGEVTLGRAAYDQTVCIKALSQLPLAPPQGEQLIGILWAGQIG